MQLTLTSWNINSVRLRIGQVQRVLADIQPDILCLQETKCPDDQFPLKELHGLGYVHTAILGQKGYHGVAIASRLPLKGSQGLPFGGKADARHIAVQLGEAAGKAAGFTVHNFYVPAGGDLADPDLNPKFAHKLAFLQDLRDWGARDHPAREKTILVGDLNIAPLEHDVWSHKQLLNVVSHTPIETEALETLRIEGGWVDAMRHLRPEPEKIYTWWSYRSPDWAASNKGRRLDHIWMSPDLLPALLSTDIYRDTRGWDRPSDHVPLTSKFQL
jgi:exodeoxyribonuclease III